ncbi:hypothetical protein [Endothiovibrio diazotrophicus]
MKKTLTFQAAALIAIFSSLSASASDGESQYRPLLDTATPAVPQPQSISDLSASSSIIVRGHYGEILGQTIFYGYNRTKESLMRDYGLSEDEASIYGIPMTEYGIVVDKVIKGSNIVHEGDTVTYRKYETPERPFRAQATSERNGDFVFFLAYNPDNETFGVLSNYHIVKSIGSRAVVRVGNEWTTPFGQDIGFQDFIEETRSDVANHTIQ